MRKPTLKESIAIIGVFLSVGGYVYHIELNHTQDAVATTLKDKKIDSMVNALSILSTKFEDLRSAREKTLLIEATDKQAADVRMDNVETGLKVIETRFDDFLHYNKK